MTKDSGDGMPHRNPDASADLGVLRERLQSNEVNINRVAEDTARQIRELAANTSNQISGLANQIGKLDNSLQERGKIQWPAFSLLLAGILAIGGLAYWPINDGQRRMEVSIKENNAAIVTALGKVVDSVPSSREISASALRRDDWQRYAEERFKKVEIESNDLQKAIVPRGEHEEKWRGASLQFSDHQRQLDALKADFSGLYSPRDALTSMQRRLEDLERRLLRAAPQS